jgi:hypothetical protein
MTGDTLEVLAGNGDFHDLVPLYQLIWTDNYQPGPKNHVLQDDLQIAP